jgi:hypothetical protein
MLYLCPQRGIDTTTEAGAVVADQLMIQGRYDWPTLANAQSDHSIDQELVCEATASIFSMGGHWNPGTANRNLGEKIELEDGNRLLNSHPSQSSSRKRFFCSYSCIPKHTPQVPGAAGSHLCGCPAERPGSEAGQGIHCKIKVTARCSCCLGCWLRYAAFLFLAMGCVRTLATKHHAGGIRVPLQRRILDHQAKRGPP